MKFTLTSENEYGGPKVTFEFEEEFLEVVVENIGQFLKGSGFVFDSLEINQEPVEGASWNDEDEEDDDEEELEENRIIINPDISDNMSDTWSFPLNRPSDTITLTPQNK